MAKPKLKDYPQILRAFQSILNDQPDPPHMKVRIKGEAIVPEKWTAKFDTAEKILAAHAKLTLKKACPDVWKRDGYEDLDAKWSAWEGLVLPLNDLDALIMAHAVLKGGRGVETWHDMEALSETLYQFFDGDLRDVPQTKPVMA